MLDQPRADLDHLSDVGHRPLCALGLGEPDHQAVFNGGQFGIGAVVRVLASLALCTQ